MKISTRTEYGLRVLVTLARMRLEDTADRGKMLSAAVFQRAREIVPPPGVEMTTALSEDAGLRSILSSVMGFGSNDVFGGATTANQLVDTTSG